MKKQIIGLEVMNGDLKPFPRFPVAMSTGKDFETLSKSWVRYTTQTQKWFDKVAREMTRKEINLLLKLLQHGPLHYDDKMVLKSLSRLVMAQLAVNIVVSKNAMPDVKLGPTRKVFTPSYYAATNRGNELFKTLMHIKRIKEPVI